MHFNSISNQTDQGYSNCYSIIHLNNEWGFEIHPAFLYLAVILFIIMSIFKLFENF